HERAPVPQGLSATSATTTDETRAATHLIEEACLFYVALTRACDTVVLSYAKRYGRASYRPSPFLAPIERRLRDRLARATWQAYAPTQQLQRDGAAGSDASDEPTAQGDADSPPDDNDILLARRAARIASEKTAEKAAEKTAEKAQETTDTLTVAALETYLRCPRQYAYRYLYGFGERQIGLTTLWQGLRDTLAGLHEGFAVSSRQQDGDFIAPQTNGQSHETTLSARRERTPIAVSYERGEPGRRAGAPTLEHAPAAAPDAQMNRPMAIAPTLEEARRLFDHHWGTALSRTKEETRLASGAPTLSATERPETERPEEAQTDPTFAVYQRHGRRIAERFWRDLMRQHGLWNTLPQSDATAFDGERMTGLRPGAARTVTVQIGKQAITETLDHVEGLTPGAEHELTSLTPDDVAAGATSVRLVRYRTSGDDELTLHDLFYTLAARRLADELARTGQTTTVEARRYNLATGVSQPIVISPRQRERLERSLAEALGAVESEVYPPKPEARRCQNCPFLLVCPS
ncbi:MAG TPA: PD-(D/E)XK nuclease family protein, partial [Ktedonobacterales bacterium]|nr:PD-(D/E)XK nuclease family protein [Ktedonobacterales bacterium]